MTTMASSAPMSPRETSPLLAAPSSLSPEHDDNIQDTDSTSHHAEESRSRLMFRIAGAMYSFVVLGLFTSSIGVVLQPISRYYALTDIQVSCIFLVGPIGYVLAAQSNHLIHSRFGQRGIAVLGPAFHIVSALAIAVHPPFPVVLMAFALLAIGTGLLDGSWCAWAGSMKSANAASGLLHGSFSVGAAVGPYLCGSLMSSGHMSWYQWYYILISASAVELIFLGIAFRSEDASKHRDAKRSATLPSSRNAGGMFKHPALWVSSIYFLAYVGTETAISGWLVSFMTRARHAPTSVASLSSSGFWAGMAVGRLVLGFVTDRVGVSQATVIYLLVAILLECAFAVVRVPAVSIVLTTMLGFVMGPMFPSGIVVLARSLPKDLHVAAVSFVASIGQIGGALLPFAIGASVQGWGIGVFVYAIVLFTISALVLWCTFTRMPSTTT